MTANQQIKLAGHVFIAVIRRIFAGSKRRERKYEIRKTIFTDPGDFLYWGIA